METKLDQYCVEIYSLTPRCPFPDKLWLQTILSENVPTVVTVYWQFRTNTNFWPLVLLLLDAASHHKLATTGAGASFSPACEHHACMRSDRNPRGGAYICGVSLDGYHCTMGTFQSLIPLYRQFVGFFWESRLVSFIIKSCSLTMT